MSVNAIWVEMQTEARHEMILEPVLSTFLFEMVVRHTNFGDALGHLIATKLADPWIPNLYLGESIGEILGSNPSLVESAFCDLDAYVRLDPAVDSPLQPFLFFKGYHATQGYRIANYLWNHGRKKIALYIQCRLSEVFGVDIHPAARIGTGIMIDHANGIVIGETAVVEDGVILRHEVTLGGTGKEKGDRHPKVRSGVEIGAGTKILGNIEIGENSKIGAGSVVLRSTAPDSVTVGYRAREKHSRTQFIEGQGI